MHRPTLADHSPEPARQRLAASFKQLGEGMAIRRALPTAQRRMVGPWCFLDHFGPTDVAQGEGMRVGPHPHCGLQTVTWLYEGEILHRDSLGSLQLIRPGQLNLMTSGHGISHSEESPLPRASALHGLQFWIALPDEARDTAPAFAHHPELPQIEHQGLHCTLLVGAALGLVSPARMYSPAVGLDLDCPSATTADLPLSADFEHAVMVTQGAVLIDGAMLQPGELLYLGGQRSTLHLRSEGPARLVLIGGAAFAEPVLMWWNFVGRSASELSDAVRQWNSGDARFGQVHGFDGARLTAPDR